MKKIILYISLLLPWFLSSIFSSCTSFFEEISLPFFALPKFLYGIVWLVLYFIITFSIYLVINKIKLSNKNYNTSLIINYVFNQLYLPLFFCLKNPFLGLVISLGILISSLFLYNETKEIDKLASKLLIPYIIFMVYATILSISIYFLNF